MRLRRHVAQIIAGILAASALAAGVSASYDQGRTAAGSIEILEVASTLTIPNATSQLVQMIPTAFAGSQGPGVANVVLGGGLDTAGTGESVPMASVVQTSGGNLGISGGPDGGDASRPGESSTKLVLAQYN